MFLSPVEFAKKTGENYEFIRKLCREGKLKCEVTEGNHTKIYESELNKFSNKDYVTKEQYEKVIRENERLKTILKSIINLINGNL